MVLSKFSFVTAAALTGAICLAAVRPTSAFDVFWLPAGTSDWNNGANWSDTAGGGPRFAVPSAFFEEVGIINNGGTATLSAAIADSTGGVTLGQAAADAGTLTVNSGGVFTSEASATTNGVVAVGAAGRGTLNVSGTGSLSAPGLTLSGNAASAINLSGSANVSISGTSTLNRNVRITGPNVNFTSTGGVTLQGNNLLTEEITSAALHSPLRSPAAVSLGGNLAIQFNGVTPATNQTWNLVDAAAISGAFANAPFGRDLTVTGVAAPPVGQAYRLRQITGGTNGQLLQLGLENLLVLRVNRDTGELSLRNPQGAAVTALDGYAITSPTAGSLLTSYKGISGAPAGNAGWEKVPMNSTAGLAELKPSGSFNVSSAGTTVTLGTGFSKTAVASQGLGVSGEDLAFSYHATGGSVIQGQVEYVGTPFLNNIALIVNKTNGQATLKNDTLQSLSIDGYSILSSTGALAAGGWTSLADRPGSFPGWQESPTTSNALSETNPVGPMALAVGQSISLGTIGNFSTTAAQNSLSLKFLLGNETTFRFGTVSFTTGLTGDYNADGRVDGQDFLIWQRGGSPSPNSAGDLATWRSNFGAGASAGAASAVPEPGACALAVLAIGAVASRCGGVCLRSRRRQGLPASKTSYMAKEKTHGGERDMIRIAAILVLFLTVWHGPLAHSAVTLSFDLNQPALGPFDQSQLLDDATIPGGTTPGGGTYNSQAYTDNAGPLGQTFTAPATKHIYALTGVSVKGVGDTGGVIDSATTTWAIRISEVNGTALTPVKTVTGIPTVSGADATEWFTLSFTGSDATSLAPSKQYAFEIFTTAGWFGVDATQGDAAYAGGTGFNSAGPARSFANNTLGNLANHGYDRTFIAALAAPAGGPGDVNNSGAADINDYIIIRNNLETAVPLFTNGDLTGDSYVDLNDFRQWTLAAPPEVVASVAIPEPATACLGFVATILTVASLRRRVRRSSSRRN